MACTAYHDEIKPDKGVLPFLGHGVLLVPEGWQPILYQRMQTIRAQHQYYGEVHFQKIGKGTRQDRQFLVARDWIRFYFETALPGCPFKAFFVDYMAKSRFPYPSEPGYKEHLLRSLRATFLGAFAWSFARETQVRIRLCFDATDNELERAVALEIPQALWDSCKDRKSRGRRYPWVRVSKPAFIESDPTGLAGQDRVDSEFVQLCDVLLGACFEALEATPSKSKAGRRNLAKSLKRMLALAAEAPWLQPISFSRRFSVSMYPDDFNFAYPAVQRRKKDTGQQQKLPGFYNRDLKRVPIAGTAA